MFGYTIHNMHSQFDLRLLTNYGLSLNSKKKYFIIYCPMTWSIQGVYDNIYDALGLEIEDWYTSCNNAKNSECPYTSKYTEEFVGENHIYMKGFFQNLSVWKVLEHLTDHINDDDHYRHVPISEHNIKRQDAIEFTLSRISEKMQCYPDDVKTPYVKI